MPTGPLATVNTGRTDSGRICARYSPCQIQIIHYLTPSTHRPTCVCWMRAAWLNWLMNSVNS